MSYEEKLVCLWCQCTYSVLLQRFITLFIFNRKLRRSRKQENYAMAVNAVLAGD